MFTAELVWGLAVAADRINDGYIKEDVFVMENECRKRIKEANKAMVRNCLRTGDFTVATPEDLERGQEVRNYFKGLLFKQLSGVITDFERQALKIAQKEEFTGRDMLDFAIVSSLPAAMIRDQQRKDHNREVLDSTQLVGAVGDTVIGDITVVKSFYSKEYNKFKITARMGESFVDFWFGSDLKETVRIKGKIKNQRDNNTTQLNYVKKI
jgi:hypothetical protein